MRSIIASLENGRNLYNLIRLMNFEDLMKVLDFKKINLLLTEATNHLSLLNLRDKVENTEETRILLNSALEDVIFMFRKDGEEELRMALDTGATQTTFDLNMLLMEGISLRESIGRQALETANGIIMADIFVLDELQFGGMKFQNLPNLPNAAVPGSKMFRRQLNCRREQSSCISALKRIFALRARHIPPSSWMISTH